MHPTIPEIHISYKNPVPFDKRIKINGWYDAYQALLGHIDEDTLDLKETFMALYLTNQNHVLGIQKHSIGSPTATQVHLPEILAVACRTAALKIILAHNHPSGVLQPSSRDKLLTKTAIIAFDYLGIQIVDHLIITSEGCHSMQYHGDIEFS